MEESYGEKTECFRRENGENGGSLDLGLPMNLWHVLNMKLGVWLGEYVIPFQDKDKFFLI